MIKCVNEPTYTREDLLSELRVHFHQAIASLERPFPNVFWAGCYGRHAALVGKNEIQLWGDGACLACVIWHSQLGGKLIEGLILKSVEVWGDPAR